MSSWSESDSTDIIPWEVSMSQLVVRNVDPEVVRALKLRAAARGRSAEAEHREILRQALAGPHSSLTLQEALLAMPDVGTDRELVPRRGKARVVKL